MPSADHQFSGNYPIETRDGEIERLAIQGAAMAPDAAIMLDRIGVASGWKCLDFGCGPGGITGLMSERVGASGRVVGLDMNARFLDHARKNAPPNVEFINGDAYHAALPQGGFDLVHMRFVASTAGGPELLIKEAMRLARPGGFVALQDPDMGALNCYPQNQAWDSLKAALQGAFASVGADINLAQRSYALMRHAGLEDVQYRPFIIGVRSADSMRDYLPSTVELLRATILANKLMTAGALEAALAHCRAHIRDPDTVFTMYIVAQVWGRVPREGH